MFGYEQRTIYPAVDHGRIEGKQGRRLGFAFHVLKIRLYCLSHCTDIRSTAHAIVSPWIAEEARWRSGACVSYSTVIGIATKNLACVSF